MNYTENRGKKAVFIRNIQKSTWLFSYESWYN